MKRTKPARKINDRVPTSRGNPGACTHQDKAPCFLARLPHQDKQDHHWPDEAGAVMFALRQSRDLKTSATVYGPDGKVICSFEPRTYDVDKVRNELRERNENLQVAFSNAPKPAKSPPNPRTPGKKATPTKRTMKRTSK